MSPVRVKESTVNSSQMNKEHLKRNGPSGSTRHPNSYPGALSETTQHAGSGHASICPDEQSGQFSVDEFSLPLSDSENHDDVSLAERYRRMPSDERNDCRWQHNAEDTHRQSVKVKLCIDAEYVYVVNIDHSRLAEELDERNSTLTMMRNKNDIKRNDCSTKSRTSANSEPDERRTPMTAARSNTRKMLTGESIRKLFRVMSPASRRHRPAELHSSGSSVSGETLTGSKSSLTAAVDGLVSSNTSQAFEAGVKQDKERLSDGST